MTSIPKNSFTKVNSECLEFLNLSKNDVVKCSVKEFLNYEYPPVKIDFKIWQMLKDFYKGQEVNIKLLNKNLKDLLDETNKNFSEIIPLSPYCSGFLNDKAIIKANIIQAPFLISLNIILRSTNYVFMPYREICVLKENLDKVLYSRDLKLLSEVKKYNEQQGY